MSVCVVVDIDFHLGPVIKFYGRAVKFVSFPTVFLFNLSLFTRVLEQILEMILETFAASQVQEPSLRIRFVVC